MFFENISFSVFRRGCVETILFPRLTRDRIKASHINLIDKACSFASPRQARGQGDFDLLILK